MKPLRDVTRENHEPHEQSNPIPRVVLGLVLGLVVWAVGYIYSQRADGLATLGNQRDPAALAGAAAASGALDGKRLFVANCQACHQATGQGLAGVFPPLAASPWVTGEAALLQQILLHGLGGPIDVLGKPYNGTMPAFGSLLKDEEIAAVLTYIRSEWGNDAAAISPESVAAARTLSADRSAAWNGIQEIQGFLDAKPR